MRSKLVDNEGGSMKTEERRAIKEYWREEDEQGERREWTSEVHRGFYNAQEIEEKCQELRDVDCDECDDDETWECPLVYANDSRQ